LSIFTSKNDNRPSRLRSGISAAASFLPDKSGAVKQRQELLRTQDESAKAAAEEMLAKLGIEGASHLIRVWNNHDFDIWAMMKHLGALLTEQRGPVTVAATEMNGVGEPEVADIDDGLTLPPGLRRGGQQNQQSVAHA
jgi:hypothetical protein